MATVAVANTTANISGKTVVLAERDHTVTGLHTYDRDPSAPFAVSANSAVVTNLDADKLDGSEGSSYLHKTNDAVWTTYSPTWGGSVSNPAIGNGTLVARYCKLGRVVHVNLVLTVGSTTTFGSGFWTFTLPVTANDTLDVGSAYAFDSSAGAKWVVEIVESTTSTIAFHTLPAGAFSAVSATVPFTWATSDTLALNFTFNSAS